MEEDEDNEDDEENGELMGRVTFGVQYKRRQEDHYHVKRWCLRFHPTLNLKIRVFLRPFHRTPS